MTDKVVDMLERARADAMRDVVPPGVDNVRTTIRRRRTVTTVAGAALLTALTAGLTLAIAQGGPSQPSGNQVAGPLPSGFEPSGVQSVLPTQPADSPPTAGVPVSPPTGGFTSADPSLPVIPPPDPATQDRMAVASAALGDPDTTPWTMATAGMVSGDYENHVNDIPEGDYHLYVFCVGEGSMRIQVKAQNVGNLVLATGSVPCGDGIRPTELNVHQPISGYLRVYLTGDSKANMGSAFAFKFVNVRGEQLLRSHSPS